MTKLLIAALAALFSTPLLAQGEPPPGCSEMKGAGDFDFWLGEWDVYGPDGKLAGRNSVTKRARDCVILEQWSPGTQGAPGGSSLNFVDPKTGKWRQVWVGTNTFIDYAGGLTPDGAMLLEGEISYFGTDEPRTVPFRGRWTPSADGSVTQSFHEQDPATGEWALWFEGQYRRTGAATND